MSDRVTEGPQSRIEVSPFRWLLRRWYLLIPVALSLLTWWTPNFFSPNTIIDFADLSYPLVPSNIVQIYLHTWGFQGSGSPNSYLAPLPLWLLNSGVVSSGIPLWIANRIFVAILPLTLTGWSAYYLARSVIEGENSKPGAIVAMVFAMLSPTLGQTILFQISMAGFLLLLGSLIRGLRKDKIQARHLLLSVAGSVMLAQAPITMYLGLLVISIVLVLLVVSRYLVLTTAKAEFFGLALVCCVLANAYWLLPLGMSLTTQSVAQIGYRSALQGASQSGLAILQGYRPFASLDWVLRLVIANPVASVYSWYSSPLIVGLNFAVCATAYAAVVISRRNRSVIAFAVTGLILTLGATTIHYPQIALVYEFLTVHLPGFVIVYAPGYWLLFLAMVYAVLLGMTTACVLDKIEVNARLGKTARTLRRVSGRIALCAALFLMIGSYAYVPLVGVPNPTIFGNHTPYGNHVSAFVVPSEYNELRNLLANDSACGCKLLVLPLQGGSYMIYSWYSDYNLPDIASFVSPIPIVGQISATFPILQNITAALDQNRPDLAARLMGMASIKYVLIHFDTLNVSPITLQAPSPYSNETALPYNREIGNSTYFNRVLAGNQFALYEISPSDEPIIITSAGVKLFADTVLPVPAPPDAIRFAANYSGTTYADALAQLRPGMTMKEYTEAVVASTTVSPLSTVASHAAALWTFNQTNGTELRDLSGNENDGVLVGSPEWSTDGTCFSGSCLKFGGGAGSYVVVPDSESLRITTGFTISTWIRLDSCNKEAISYVISKGLDSTNNWSLALTQGECYPEVIYFDGTSNQVATGNNPILPGEWHLLTATWDGSPFVFTMTAC